MERTEGDEDDHPDGDVDLTATMPVLEYSPGGTDIVGGDDEILHEIIVSKGETKCRVHKTSSIAGEASFVRNVCGHFTERNHDKVTNKTDETVSDKDTEWTASGELGFGLRGRMLNEWGED